MAAAEIEEGAASGVTGARCPFCNSRQAMFTAEGYRDGVQVVAWWCENCGESGRVLPDGTLWWWPEP